jgi:hypothetical protein
MSEKPEESFDDDEDEDAADGGESLNLDELIRDLDSTKKRRGARVSTTDPAWRQLERYLEEKRTAEQMSDFDDYDIGDEDAEVRPRRKKKM